MSRADRTISKAEKTKTDARALFSVLSAVIAASLLLPLPGRDGRIGHLPPLCPFHALTGLPCPGCGLTRAFVCLGHGHFFDSLHWHPLGWLIFAACLLLWLRSGLLWLFSITLWPLSDRAAGQLGWGALGLLLLTGVARIGWLTTHHLRF